MPLPDVAIEVARDRRAMREFILLPWKIYKHDPLWVAPLIMDMEKMLDRTKHPFHQHAEVEYFVARRVVHSSGPSHAGGGKAGDVIGRIAAIINHAHNEFHGEKTGFVGFFESIEESAVSQALFHAAADWLAERGMERMRGPANFSSNEEWGLLVDGFDSSPMVMMTYNPPHYARRFEEFGFEKAKDVVAYFLDNNSPPERLLRGARRIAGDGRITIRPLNMKRFDQEVELVRDIYNRAWEKNWGFVPMTEAEIKHMAKELKPVVDPRIVLFAEFEGKTIGFALALPNAYQALKKAKGRLFPFGLIKILIEAKKIRYVRVLTLGVVKEHRGLGADALLYLGIYEGARERGYLGGEFSWILEDNAPMRRALEHLGARVYKTYRLYDYSLIEHGR